MILRSVLLVTTIWPPGRPPNEPPWSPETFFFTEATSNSSRGWAGACEIVLTARRGANAAISSAAAVIATAVQAAFLRVKRADMSANEVIMVAFKTSDRNDESLTAIAI